MKPTISLSTNISLLSNSVNALKKDPILLAPYLLFCLTNTFFLPFLIPTTTETLTITTTHYIYFIVSAIIQSLVGCLLIFGILNFKKEDINIPLCVSLFSKHLKKCTALSIIVNLPLTLMLYFILNIHQSQLLYASAFITNSLLFIFIIFIAFIFIPFSTFSHFIYISFCHQPKNIIMTIFKQLQFCFNHYKLCIKWFSVIVILNLIQLLTILITNNWAIQEFLNATIQALILTLTMVYSTYFYKHINQQIKSKP